MDHAFWGWLVSAGLAVERIVSARIAARKAQADGSMSLLDLTGRLEDSVVRQSRRAESAEDTIAALRLEIATLKSKLATWERYGPLELAAEQIFDLEGLEHLLEHLLDAIVVTSAANEGTFLLVTDSLLDMLGGLDREDLLGTKWRERLAPDDVDRTANMEAAAWDEDVQMVNEFRGKDGKYHRIRWIARAYRDRDGAKPGCGISISIVRPAGRRSPKKS